MIKSIRMNLWRGSFVFASSLATYLTIGASLVQAEPSFLPGYSGSGYNNNSLSSFGQDAFACPTPVLHFTGFGLDGDSSNRIDGFNDASRQRSANLLSGSGFGAALGVTIPLSSAFGNSCKEFARQLNQERQLNTAMSKFRACAYLRWIGIDLDSSYNKIKDIAGVPELEKALLNECIVLGIQFVEAPRPEVSAPKTSSQSSNPNASPSPPASLPQAKDGNAFYQRIKPRAIVVNASEGFPDPGPITGAVKPLKDEVKDRQRPTFIQGAPSVESVSPSLSGFGYFQEPVQRQRIVR